VAAPVTVTPNVQLREGAIVAPLMVMVLGAVRVTVPPHTPALAFGTVRPTGRVSENPIPVIEVPLLGLEMTKLRVVVPPMRIGWGLKDIAMLGGESAKAGLAAARAASARARIPLRLQIIANVSNMVPSRACSFSGR
jgi:hypothetical protein